MDKEHFLLILEKYLDDKATEEEVNFLYVYYSLFMADADVIELLKGNEKEKLKLNIKAGIDGYIDGHIDRADPVRKLRLWPLIAAAATVVLVIGAVLFVFKQRIAGNQITAQVAKNEVVPGSNKAILIMPNGKTISLTDAANGLVVQQAGVSIRKSKGGQLTYVVNHTPTTERQAATADWNTIRTPRGGQYEVMLADGTHVWLNAASSLRFPQTFNGPQRLVELSGEAYFEVAKDKSHPFIVQANGTKVQVYGTHFNVNAYPDNSMVTTTLLEGSVQMSHNGQATMLIPGEQGTSPVSGGAVAVSRADLQQAIAWKNGYFLFHDLGLAEVMRQVSRWYDVDIEFQDEEVKSREFGGVISRYKSITQLLDNMQLTGSAHYKIEGRRVIIMK